MKKLSVLALAILALLSCKKEMVEQSIDAQFKTSYAEIINLPSKESKAWFTEQSAETKAAVWKYKLKHALQFEWNTQQKELLAGLIYELDASIFHVDDNRSRQLEETWMNKAKNHFTLEQLFKLVGTLSAYQIQSTYKTAGPTPGGGAVAPWGECECSKDSDYCNFPIPWPKRKCDLTKKCTNSSNGCGFLTKYPCKGICSSV